MMEKLLMLIMMTIAAAMAACPADLEMDARKDELKACMQPLDDALAGEETDNSAICDTLKTAATCIFSKLDDCGELGEHFAKPHMLHWIMIAQALGCPAVDIDDERLQFDSDKGSNCSFYEFYTCNKDLLDALGVSPTGKDKQNVTIAALRQWFMFNTMITDDQEETCKKFEDKDTDAILECVDKLEKHCSPLGRPKPPMTEGDGMDGDDDRNTTTGERDDKKMEMKPPSPFSERFLHRAVDSCSDGCSGLTDRKTAYADCSTAETVTGSTEETIDALVIAILANKDVEEQKDDLERQCGVMGVFVDCVENAVGECKPLGDDVKGPDDLGKATHRDALAACELNLDDVGKTTSAAGLAGLAVELLMVVPLLIASIV